MSAQIRQIHVRTHTYVHTLLAFSVWKLHKQMLACFACGEANTTTTAQIVLVRDMQYERSTTLNVPYLSTSTQQAYVRSSGLNVKH